MIGYASNTGTIRNLAALKLKGWRILVTPAKPKPPEGFKYALDNGAWNAHQKLQPFNERAFSSLVEHHAAAADFVIIPDIVAGGMDSLALSRLWIPRLKHLKNILLPVQDGMDVPSVSRLLHAYGNLGIFLGGSTEWKLKTMPQWGALAASMNRHYHIGRVNTKRRIRLAAEAGADSFDGTSASMFSCTLPLLEAARIQPSLLAPPKGALLQARGTA